MRRIKIYNLSTGTVGVPFFGTINPEGKADLTLNNTDADFIVSGLSALEDSGKIALEVINLDGGDPVTKTSAKMDIYVDGDNGDDGNAGTQALPLKTITEAEQRVPDVYHDSVIHVKGGVSAPYTLKAFRPRRFTKRLGLICDWGGDENDGFSTITSGTAQAGSGRKTLVTSGGLGTDTYQGCTILIESGAAAGDIRYVSTHTDTDITSTHPFSAALQTGDEWRIVEAAATLRPEADNIVRGGPVIPVPARTTVYHKFALPGVVMANFKMDPTNTEDLSIAGHVQQFGIEWTGAPWTINAHDQSMTVGVDYDPPSGQEAQVAMELFGAPNKYSWAGWGWSSRSSGVFPFISGGSVTIAGAVVDRLACQYANVAVRGFYFWNFGCRALGGVPNIPARPTSLFLLYGEIDDTKIAGYSFGSVWGARADGAGAELYLGGQAGLEMQVEAPGVEAIQIEHGAQCYIRAADVIDSDVGAVARTGGFLQYHDTDFVITKADTADVRVEDAVGGNTDGTLGVAPLDAANKYISAGDGSTVQVI